MAEADCPLCGTASPFAWEGGDRLYAVPGTWRYHRCPACGIEFQHPLPGPVEIERFYPEDYAQHARPRVKAPSGLRRAVLRTRYRYRHLDAPLLLRLLAPLVGVFRYRDEVAHEQSNSCVDLFPRCHRCACLS